MDNNHRQYLKREQKRKLSAFQELSALSLGWGASFMMAAVLLLSSVKFHFRSFGTNPVNYIVEIKSPAVFVVFLIYLAAGVLMLLLAANLKRSILAGKGVPDKLRVAGYPCIPFILTGNIFAAIAGFTLIEKKRSLEYTLGFYAFLNNIFILLLSYINIFKTYVSPYFLLGMGILGASLIFYLVSLVIIQRQIAKDKYASLKPLAFLQILTAVSGNFFALLLGLMILSKIRNAGSSRTIGWIDVLRRIFRNYMAVLGLFLVIFFLSLSICSYLTFDYSYAIDNNYSELLREPCPEYPFGTDQYGRCVYSRIAFGARISLVIGLASTAIPIAIGGTMGAVAGHYGKQLDNVLMRCLDVLYAVPSTLLAIAIIAAFGANTFNLILALSIGMIPVYARTMRAQVMVVGHSEFVEAARACGRKEYEILLKHITPNSLAPIIVRATLGIGVAVLSTSSLSYLGLGVEPHIPEWGNVLKVGSQYLETNPYLAIYPGVAIILIVLAFNFFGDGLRDALDPKLK